MGMCAIYTAVQPPEPDALHAIARANEQSKHAPHRCTLGRTAIVQMVRHVVPPSHHTLVKKIYERDLWGFLTPAATRGNHAAKLQAAHTELHVPTPLWPEGIEMALLVGASPATYLGNNLVAVQPEHVAIAVAAFERLVDVCDPAAYFKEFLTGARDREDCVLLHWDYR
jgi:hypothetical protein